MDLQSFIQSGLLEAYVAGHCSAAERQQVEQMAAQHPEIRAELARIEQALENYALANAVPPPADLKNRILDQLDKIPDISPTNAPKTGSSASRWIAVAAVAAIALAAFFYWQKMTLSAENNRLKDQANALQTQLNDCTKRTENVEPMAQLLRDTDTKPVTMTDGKAYQITIFNNPVRQECALDITSVPAPGAGKYFQCWAIVDGVPVSLGMVQMNAPGSWQPLKYIPNATAYAISEEPNPEGNPKPTVVIAIGSVKVG